MLTRLRIAPLENSDRRRFFGRRSDRQTRCSTNVSGSISKWVVNYLSAITAAVMDEQTANSSHVGGRRGHPGPTPDFWAFQWVPLCAALKLRSSDLPNLAPCDFPSTWARRRADHEHDADVAERVPPPAARPCRQPETGQVSAVTMDHHLGDYRQRRSFGEAVAALAAAAVYHG